MKIIFLDHDGVICLSTEWGKRLEKRKKYHRENGYVPDIQMPVHYRFDNFNKKAIGILNEILNETGAEIVVSSDWKNWANIEEMGEYYESQGVIKKPIAFTPKSIPSNFIAGDPDTDLEETRSWEILEWLKENPEVTHWVAVDDLNMEERFGPVSGNYIWGLKNFVLTPKSREGIKQNGIKEKIIGFLK